MAKAQTGQTEARCNLIELFLTDLRYANHSPYTLRAFATDRAQLLIFYTGPAQNITAETLPAYRQSVSYLAPASRSRKPVPP